MVRPLLISWSRVRSHCCLALVPRLRMTTPLKSPVSVHEQASSGNSDLQTGAPPRTTLSPATIVNSGPLSPQRTLIVRPIWLASHQTMGASIWLPRVQPLRKRVQALRTLRDLRWHGKNRAVVTQSRYPQVSECPLCHRYWSQAHLLEDCPGNTSARTGGSPYLTIAVNRLPPGPTLDLGRKFQALLTIPNQPALMARRWAGQWDKTAIDALRPDKSKPSSGT